MRSCRVSRPRSATSCFRLAALVLGAMLLGALLSAGTRVAYCSAMGPLEGAHCACMAQPSSPWPAPALEATDCHRVMTAGSLPPGTNEIRSAPVAASPCAAVASLGTQPDAPTGWLATSLAPRTARQRAGPSRPAIADRSHLMVFLL